MGRRNPKPKLNSPTSGGTGVGAYDKYYKAQSVSKTNPKAYQTANAAISKALADGGYPQEWLQPVLELVARESSFNPNAKNPSSSAAGLFQFLSGTRKAYGKYINGSWDDPYNQAVAGLKYISDRYKDPVKALQFWDKNNYY